MRVPIRKAGKYTFIKPDPHLTAEKFQQLSNQLQRLSQIVQPRAIVEVQRLAEMGDFSENAAYQMAKGRLRGLNQKIIELQEHLQEAIIINQPTSSTVVCLGSRVIVEINGRRQIYHILGSAETNPTTGVISHNSPIGAALLGGSVGETVRVRLATKEVNCRIIGIE